MKALTLWQPWASLIAVGAKTIKTRGWPTRFRGPLAISASKLKAAQILVAEEMQFSNLSDFMIAVHRVFCKDQKKGFNPNHLPHGAIIATAELCDCLYIGEGFLQPKKPEILFGDFSFGRWAWCLKNIKALPEPIPARGRQGLWEWNNG